MSPWSCNLPSVYSQPRRHWGILSLSLSTFLTLQGFKSKVLWSINSLDPCHPRSREGYQNRSARGLCFVQRRLVLLSQELGSLTKVASFCKVECHRKGCDCVRNARAVCLPLAGRLPEGPAARLPGASSNCLHTELSTHLKTCRPALSLLLKSESSCDLFLTWLLLNWQLHLLEGFLFYKACWGIKGKWVPLAPFALYNYLHIF